MKRQLPVNLYLYNHSVTKKIYLFDNLLLKIKSPTLKLFTMPTTIFDTYATNESATEITLSVQIGFAQLGSTSVLIDTDQIIVPPADANGNYRGNFSIPIGTNASLGSVNGLLQMTTNVDILMLPGQSSVTLTLTGGAAPQTFVMNNPAAGVAVGDVINFSANITFN